MFISKTPHLLKQLFPSVLWTCETDIHLRITFDDGPHPDSTPYILDLLDAHSKVATFFCLGKRVEKYPRLYQQIINRGHKIGNHGYEHLSGWTTSTTKYLEDIDRASQVIDSQYFRPAYGRMRLSQLSEIKKTYTVALWDIMTWDFKTSVTPESVCSRINSYATPESIILFHDQPKCLPKIKAALAIL